ncbi:hypothetical protein SMD11_6423 [Streptomyces albireticuli]|uniref:Lipoprotein n=1 Tax=Streptomyces albireticuli TaxID=1940 RepID=A0A1Z2LCG5_9ACTN|nr:hypothetical protein [Streptomyces albireticuli]ARZ71999.1 hypothetical protein SMD11_6423 [Streptomyces albireticuli]
MPRSAQPGRTRTAAPARRRPVRALAAAALLAVAATGCASVGEPVSAGTTAPVAAPSRLWADRPPAPTPTGEQHEDDSATNVPGLPAVPSGDIRKVDPYAVIKAEVAAHRHDVTGADGLDEATAAKLATCDGRTRDCPLRPPVYRDLTGDGHDELVMGIEMADHLVGLRCYTVTGGRLTRVMATVVQPTSIEIAGRDLIVWEPAGTPHYAVRSVYAWDAHRRYMEFKSDEIRRVGATPSPRAQERHR